MPYKPSHKKEVRAKIVESARMLFNCHGFERVTIDMVMESAGLTRGGFYHHFKNKEELYREAVMSFLAGRGAQWREEAGIYLDRFDPDIAQQMIDAYLSDEHLCNLEGQCPMVALPSDVARGGEEVRGAYQTLLSAMVSLFEKSIEGDAESCRQRALSIAALCVGGMVLAKALPDCLLAKEVQRAARDSASQIIRN